MAIDASMQASTLGALTTNIVCVTANDTYNDLTTTVLLAAHLIGDDVLEKSVASSLANILILTGVTLTHSCIVLLKWRKGNSKYKDETGSNVSFAQAAHVVRCPAVSIILVIFFYSPLVASSTYASFMGSNPTPVQRCVGLLSLTFVVTFIVLTTLIVTKWLSVDFEWCPYPNDVTWGRSVIHFLTRNEGHWIDRDPGTSFHRGYGVVYGPYRGTMQCFVLFELGALFTLSTLSVVPTRKLVHCQIRSVLMLFISTCHFFALLCFKPYHTRRSNITRLMQASLEFLIALISMVTRFVSNQQTSQILFLVASTLVTFSVGLSFVTVSLTIFRIIAQRRKKVVRALNNIILHLEDVKRNELGDADILQTNESELEHDIHEMPYCAEVEMDEIRRVSQLQHNLHPKAKNDDDVFDINPFNLEKPLLQEFEGLHDCEFGELNSGPHAIHAGNSQVTPGDVVAWDVPRRPPPPMCGAPNGQNRAKPDFSESHVLCDIEL